jgi:hypothetical protein
MILDELRTSCGLTADWPRGVSWRQRGAWESASSPEAAAPSILNGLLRSATNPLFVLGRMFRAMSRKNRWRFCLQIVDGPSAGLGAGPWRLWTHRDDIYIAATGQEDTIKVSLHESGKWRIAYTAEHMGGEHPLWSRTADRAAWKFDAPPFVGGVQEAFVVATVRPALRPVELDGREAIVAIEDRWDRLTGVRVIVTDPHIQVVPAEKLVFDEPLRLASGRLVWLRAFDEEVEAVDQEPVPVGQLIRVLTPETNEVSIPGYLVVGANVA